MGRNALRHAPVVTSVLMVIGLLGVLPLAMRSTLIAVAIAGLLVIVILVGWLGLNRASVVLMVLAFALAPDDKLGVSFLGISDVLFFLALGLAFPRLLRTPIRLPIAFMAGSLVFATIALLSSVAAADSAVYYYSARVVFMFVILPILVVWWAPRGKVLVWLLAAYAIGTCISVAYGLPKIGSFRNFGLTQHPNVLGYTTTLAMALVPFLFVALPREWRYWICGSVLAGVGVGIVTSGSRAALVVALVLIVLVPAVERSIPLGLAVVTTGVIAVGYVGEHGSPAQGQNAVARLLGAGDATDSDQARVNGVKSIWSVAVHHPWLGIGFNFSDFVGHNVYVQVAAAVGFLGVAAFVVLLFAMVTPLFATGNIHSRLVYPAIVFIVAGPVSPQLTDRYIGLLLGTALVGVNAVRAERQAEVTEPEPSRLLRLNR